MRHLVNRLPDFPDGTSVALNMGFNCDGNPAGDQDARPWIAEIARTNPVHTWDFSLTEGENAVIPHWRYERLFQRRREERAAGPYQGGICYTMTPKLNLLTLRVRITGTRRSTRRRRHDASDDIAGDRSCGSAVSGNHSLTVYSLRIILHAVTKRCNEA